MSDELQFVLLLLAAVPATIWLKAAFERLSAQDAPDNEDNNDKK